MWFCFFCIRAYARWLGSNSTGPAQRSDLRIECEIWPSPGKPAYRNMTRWHFLRGTGVNTHRGNKCQETEKSVSFLSPSRQMGAALQGGWRERLCSFSRALDRRGMPATNKLIFARKSRDDDGIQECIGDPRDTKVPPCRACSTYMFVRTAADEFYQ